MRPRPIGRGNRVGGIDALDQVARFNEAAANWPRKCRPRRRREAMKWGFNEAAANWPRKFGHSTTTLKSSLGFNEAAANWPRKSSAPRSIASASVSLQ